MSDVPMNSPEFLDRLKERYGPNAPWKPPTLEELKAQQRLRDSRRFTISVIFEDSKELKVISDGKDFGPNEMGSTSLDAYAYEVVQALAYGLRENLRREMRHQP